MRLFLARVRFFSRCCNLRGVSFGLNLEMAMSPRVSISVTSIAKMKMISSKKRIVCLYVFMSLVLVCILMNLDKLARLNTSYQ